MAKKCKCKIISFGHINLYFLLIPLGALFRAAKELITSNSTKFGETDKEKQHPIIITINYASGLCLSFIFFLIYKIYNKRKKISKIFLFEKIMYKSTSNKKITNKEKFLWILLGSVIDFIANVIYAYNWLDDENDDYLLYYSTNIIFLALFSYLLLKMKLYKHHYLSVGIIIIIGIADDFISGCFDKDKIKQNYKGYIIYFIVESTFNSLYVFNKFIMVNKFIKSYVILFFQGIIELVLGIISLVITTKYFKNFDNFFLYIEDLNKSEIFFFFGLILANFVTYLTIYIIIDIFTPFHIFLLTILSDMIILIIEDGLDFSEDIHASIMYIFFVIIGIFMILVFIEIIQLNFCGLSYMTKKNIEERARIDSMLNDNDDDEEEVTNEEDNEEINKKENDKDKEGKRITIRGYSVELKDLNNDQFNPLLPSDLSTVESNI